MRCRSALTWELARHPDGKDWGPIRCLVEIGLMKRTKLGEFEFETSYLVIQW